MTAHPPAPPQPETGERHEYVDCDCLNPKGCIRAGLCHLLIFYDRGPGDPPGNRYCAQPRSSPVHGEPKFMRYPADHRFKPPREGETGCDSWIHGMRCGHDEPSHLTPPAPSEEPRIGGRTRAEWRRSIDVTADDAELDALLAAAFESKQGGWNGRSAKEWSLALQGLTPGGSEFASSPEACVEYLRDERHRAWERIKKLTLQVRDLEAAAESKQGGEGWRPIESAPRDGTKVLLWWQTCPEPAIGRWETDDSERLYGAREGWRCEGDQCIPKNQGHCTHWMPLTSAPPLPQSEKENRE